MTKKTLITTAGLKLDKDFEVVSIIVLDKYFNTISFEDFFKEESIKLYEKYTENFASQLIEEKLKVVDIIDDFFNDEEVSNSENSIHAISTTFIDLIPPHFYYFDDIRFDIAIMVGLGVVRMNTREHKGRYMLYNVIEDIDLDEEEILIEELLKISIYKTLIDEKPANEGIYKLLHNNPNYLMSLCTYNEEFVLERLEEIFQLQKEKKNNIIQFPAK